jgi:Flp pilus assembly protein TadD
MYKKNLTIEEALERKLGMATAYTNLGDVYRIRGDLEKAEEMQKTSLDLYEAVGSKGGIATAYGNLGYVYVARGDLTQAEAMYVTALRLFQVMGVSKQAETLKQSLADLRQSK